MDPYRVWYHKDSKAFRLSSKVRKFKSSGQSDSEFAQMVIDNVDKVLLTSCIAESLSTVTKEKCLCLKDSCKEPLLLVKPNSTRRYSAYRLKNSRSKKFVALDLHRALLHWKEGPPDGEGHDALHEYDCLGGCINPTHLHWGTPMENAADRQKLMHR